MAAKSKVVALRGTRPNIINGKVSPSVRQKKADRRSREHLTPGEVEKLMKAGGATGRHGHRDAILLMVV